MSEQKEPNLVSLGKIVKITNTEEISATFKKREFVIETDENYPQKMMFELVQDKCDLVSGYNINDNVRVHFNLRGREWSNPQNQVKYFVNLRCWRLEKVGESIPPVNESTLTTTEVETSKDTLADDLPDRKSVV